MKRCQQHKDLDWMQFVNDEPDDRAQYESALAGCDYCLEIYMKALAANLEAPSPQFTDLVMTGLPTNGRSGRFKAWRPVLHYLVAACLTLAFLELGLFDFLSTISDQSQALLPENDVIGELMGRIQTLIDYLKF